MLLSVPVLPGQVPLLLAGQVSLRLLPPMLPPPLLEVRLPLALLRLPLLMSLQVPSPLFLPRPAEPFQWSAPAGRLLLPASVALLLPLLLLPLLLALFLP